MKKSQNGFIVPILLAIIAFLLAGGVAYIYTQKKSENQALPVTETPQATSTASMTSQNVLSGISIKDIYKGETFDNLTVTDIKFLMSSTSDAKKEYLSSATVSFSGNIILSGKVWWNEMLSKSCMVADQTDINKTPRFKEDKRSQWFCFSNLQSILPASFHDVTKTSPGGGIPVTVEIANYTVNYSEKESSDSASFIRMVAPLTPQLPAVTTNIVVTYPNGGEKLTVNEQDSMPKGSNFITRWTSNNLTGTTNIYLISAIDDSVCLLGTASVNQGAFGSVLGTSFKCKNTSKLLTSGQYKVRLIADTQSPSSDLGVNDMSDNYFTLNVVSTNSQTICKSVVDGMPVITSLSSTSGPIGTVLEINGCGLAGFEGDLNVYFEKDDGTKFLLTDTSGDFRTTGGKLIKVTVKEPCQKGETIYGAYSGIASVCNSPKMTSGVYKVYTTPWNKKSNVVSFTVTVSPTTIVGAVYNSVYIKDNGANGEFLFTDNNSKIWTVYYRGANFSEYSASTGKAQGTNGLLKTTLQDWLKIQKHVGDSVDLAGAPGTLTITGRFSDDHVLIASSIAINGQ